VVLEPWVVVALGFVGLAAGFVDAVAGGGGLIGIPALLAFGVPPVAALATNKVQAVVGTAIAVATFWRRGFIDFGPLVPALLATFIGSVLGAVVVKLVDTSVLSYAIPVALIVIAAYFLFSKSLSDADRAARLDFARYVPLFGFVIGFYDGVFGPGAGTFFTLAFVALFGLGVTRATGHAKALNITSNLAACVVFVPAGDVLWPAALAMAVGQVAGGYLGARSGIRWGATLIRPLIVVVSVAIALRLLFFR
jgi:uncharacterized membrane protein YfcA